MNTSELLKGLRQRRAELKAELTGIEAAIAGLTNAAESLPPKRVYTGEFPNTCIQCGKAFKSKRKKVKFCSKGCTSSWWNDDRIGKHKAPSVPLPIAPRTKGTVLVPGAR